MRIEPNYLNIYNQGIEHSPYGLQYQKYRDESGQEWSYRYVEPKGDVRDEYRFSTYLNVHGMSDNGFSQKFALLFLAGTFFHAFWMQIPLRIVDFVTLGFVRRGKQVADWDWKLVKLNDELTQENRANGPYYLVCLVKYSAEHFIHDVVSFVLIPLTTSAKLNFAFLGLFDPRSARHCYNGIEARFSLDYHYFTEMDSEINRMIGFSAVCMSSTQSNRLWVQMNYGKTKEDLEKDRLIRHLFRLHKLRSELFAEDFDPYKIREAKPDQITKLIGYLENTATIDTRFLDEFSSTYAALPVK